MSLIDTIGPIIFVAFLGLGVLVLCISGGLTMLESMRVNHAQRQLVQARTQNALEAGQFITDLAVAVDCDPLLADAMPDDLQAKLWKLQLERKELT